MKKLLFILLTILITFPLMGQENEEIVNYLNRLQQNKNHQKSVTNNIKRDTVYIIKYVYLNNDFYRYNRPCYYGYNGNYSQHNWYYNDNLWSYHYNWNYNDYPNYRHKYKPRPHYNRQRTIGATRNIKPINKPNEVRPNRPIRKSNEYIRPVRTDIKYNRPSSTYQKPTRMRYNQHNHRNVVNKPNNNVRQRIYNSNGNRSGTSNDGSVTKTGTSNRSFTTKSGTSNRCSSGNRGRR